MAWNSRVCIRSVSNEASDTAATAGMIRCAIINRRFAFHLTDVLWRLPNRTSRSARGTDAKQLRAWKRLCLQRVEFRRRELTDCGTRTHFLSAFSAWTRRSGLSRRLCVTRDQAAGRKVGLDARQPTGPTNWPRSLETLSEHHWTRLYWYFHPFDEVLRQRGDQSERDLWLD